MIIVMDKSATQQQIDNVIEKIKDKGLMLQYQKELRKLLLGQLAMKEYLTRSY